MNNQLNPNDILVFVGPTINLAEAKKILPQARYLPPVRCGDILRYLRLKPKVIAIIDGLFERTGAVWHKEIIFALETGVKVYGASSMGALRAAELHPYGMVGIGDIFTSYRDGLYEDDDEVAVLHASDQGDFTPLTDAMVNIRATIASAIKQKIIPIEVGKTLVDRAKNSFYTERILEDVIAQTKLQGIAVDSLEKLEIFIKTGGYVNLKKIDAIALLKKLANLFSQKNLIRATKTPQVNRSVFFSAIHKIVACRPLSQDFNWLPMADKVALESRLLGKKYLLLRSLAELLQMCDVIAYNWEILPTQQDIEKVYTDKILGLETTNNYLQANDLNTEAMSQFVDRLAKIQALLRLQAEKYHKNFNLFFLINLRINNQYVALSRDINLPAALLDEAVINNCQELDEDLEHIYRAIAKLWQIIDWIADISEFYPDRKKIVATMNDLWRDLGISDKQSKLNWLKDNNLNWDSFTQMMFIFTRLKIISSRQDLSVLGLKMPGSEVVFLHDALRLTKVYLKLKTSLNLNSLGSQKTAINKICDRDYLLKTWCKKNQEPLPENVNKYAHILDFEGGENELLECLNQRLLTTSC
ncbi:MAG: hypothetical protein Tsb0014_16010 [Pleurocapsa sp.]